MKKTFIMIFAAVFTFHSLLAMPGECVKARQRETKETRFVGKTKSIRMTKGTTQTIKWQQPKGKVQWKVADKKIVTVVTKAGTYQQKIKIKAKKTGTTKLVAKCKGKKYTIKVKVLAKEKVPETIPEVTTKSEEVTTQEIITESETVITPETTAEPKTVITPGTTIEPETAITPEITIEPEKTTGQLQPTGEEETPHVEILCNDVGFWVENVEDLIDWMKNADASGSAKHFLEVARQKNDILVVRSQEEYELSNILVYVNQECMAYAFHKDGAYIGVGVSLSDGLKQGLIPGSETMTWDEVFAAYNEKLKSTYVDFQYKKGTVTIGDSTIDYYYHDGGYYKKTNGETQLIGPGAYFEIDGTEVRIDLSAALKDAQWDNQYIQMFQFQKVPLKAENNTQPENKDFTLEVTNQPVKLGDDFDIKITNISGTELNYTGYGLIGLEIFEDNDWKAVDVLDGGMIELGCEVQSEFGYTLHIMKNENDVQYPAWIMYENLRAGHYRLSHVVAMQRIYCEFDIVE